MDFHTLRHQVISGKSCPTAGVFVVSCEMEIVAKHLTHLNTNTPPRHHATAQDKLMTIFSNCLWYNRPGSHLHDTGLQLRAAALAALPATLVQARECANRWTTSVATSNSSSGGAEEEGVSPHVAETRLVLGRLPRSRGAARVGNNASEAVKAAVLGVLDELADADVDNVFAAPVLDAVEGYKECVRRVL